MVCLEPTICSVDCRRRDDHGWIVWAFLSPSLSAPFPSFSPLLLLSVLGLILPLSHPAHLRPALAIPYPLYHLHDLSFWSPQHFFVHFFLPYFLISSSCTCIPLNFGRLRFNLPFVSTSPVIGIRLSASSASFIPHQTDKLSSTRQHLQLRTLTPS